MMMLSASLNRGLEDNNITDVILPNNDELQKSMFYYQQMMMLFDSAIKCITLWLDLMKKECVTKGWHVPIHLIESRIKDPISINKKLQTIGAPLTIQSIQERLNDVAGVRVICKYLPDIYIIRDMIISVDHIELIKEKDYIKNPKANGYRSLHLIVNVPVPIKAGFQKVKCEIQLRTIAMDSWASLEHNLRYKNDLTQNEEIDQELKHCADVLHETDQRMQRIAERMKIFN